MKQKPLDFGSTESGTADFRISFSGPQGWQVAVLSERARRWADQNLNNDLSGVRQNELTTNLGGVNSLLHRARLAGLATEYIGPHARVLL